MEIRAELQKSYTEEQRLNFIVEQNYNHGYEIRETETALEAWGYTQAEKEEQERERISHLKCTKRVLVLILEQLGLDYFEQIEPLINSNRQAKLEWELCVELERNNPLLNVIGAELGISPQQIDQVFKYANGEVETLAIMED